MKHITDESLKEVSNELLLEKYLDYASGKLICEAIKEAMRDVTHLVKINYPSIKNMIYNAEVAIEIEQELLRRMENK